MVDNLGVVIEIDGACAPNPGQETIGVVVRSEDGTVLRKIAERLGPGTNNTAEYKALIRGLAEAAALGARTVEVRSDSQLLVRQINGRYAVSSENIRPLYEEAVQALVRMGKWSVVWVPREQNVEADALSESAFTDGEREWLASTRRTYGRPRRT